MKPELEKQGLPASILALLEGSPAHLPDFPDIRNRDALDLEEERITPGGPSSSEILRKRESRMREDLDSVLQETVRVRQRADSAQWMLAGLTTLQTQITSCLLALSGSLTSGDAKLVDFAVPGSALMNYSSCSYEPLYGQVTLPYAVAPQSQIRRLTGYGPRPGALVRYARIDRQALDVNRSNTFVWDESDPESTFVIDGRLDTAWTVPIGSQEDLVVSVSLPPTLGASTRLNALGILPWPLYGCSIVEAWIRNGEAEFTTIPGWEQVPLEGQLGYESGSGTIENAGAVRLFFPPSPVKEVLVRLRPNADLPVIGLVHLDIWTVEFQPAGTVILDSSEVGIPVASRAVLAGPSPASLSRLNVTQSGAEITIHLAGPSPYESPVLTSVSLYAPAEGFAGFDFSVWAE